MHTHPPPPKHHPVTYPHRRAVDFDVQPILQVIARQGHNGLPPSVIPSLYHLRRGQAGLCGMDGGRDREDSVRTCKEGLGIGGCSSAGPPHSLSSLHVTVPGARRRRWLPTRRPRSRLWVWEGRVMGREGRVSAALSPRQLQPSAITQLTECTYLHGKVDGRERSRTKAGPVRVEEKERGVVRQQTKWPGCMLLVNGGHRGKARSLSGACLLL